MSDYAIEAFISWCDDMTISQESSNDNEGFFAKCKRVIKSCIDTVIKWFKSIPDKFKNAKNRMKGIIDKIRANFNKVDKAKSNDEAAKFVEDSQKNLKEANKIIHNVIEDGKRLDDELEKTSKLVNDVKNLKYQFANNHTERMNKLNKVIKSLDDISVKETKNDKFIKGMMDDLDKL